MNPYKQLKQKNVGESKQDCNEIKAENEKQQNEINNIESDNSLSNNSLVYLPVDLLHFTFKSKNIKCMPGLLRKCIDLESPGDIIHFMSDGEINNNLSLKYDSDNIDFVEQIDTSTVYSYTKSQEYKLQQIPSIYQEVQYKIDMAEQQSHKQLIHRQLLLQEEQEKHQANQNPQNQMANGKPQNSLVRTSQYKHLLTKDGIEQEEQEVGYENEDQDSDSLTISDDSSLLDCDYLRKINIMARGKGQFKQNRQSKGIGKSATSQKSQVYQSQSQQQLANQSLKTGQQQQSEGENHFKSKKMEKLHKKFGTKYVSQNKFIEEEIYSQCNESVNNLNDVVQEQTPTSSHQLTNGNQKFSKPLSSKQRLLLQKKKKLEKEQNDIEFEIVDEEILDQDINNNSNNYIPPGDSKHIMGGGGTVPQEYKKQGYTKIQSQNKLGKQAPTYDYNYFFKKSNLPKNKTDLSIGYQEAFGKIIDTINNYSNKQKEEFIKNYIFQDELNYTKVGPDYQTEIPHFQQGIPDVDALTFQAKKWFGNNRNQEDIAYLIKLGNYDKSSMISQIQPNARLLKQCFKQNLDQVEIIKSLVNNGIIFFL